MCYSVICVILFFSVSYSFHYSRDLSFLTSLSFLPYPERTLSCLTSKFILTSSNREDSLTGNTLSDVLHFLNQQPHRPFPPSPSTLSVVFPQFRPRRLYKFFIVPPVTSNPEFPPPFHPPTPFPPYAPGLVHSRTLLTLFSFYGSLDSFFGFRFCFRYYSYNRELIKLRNNLIIKSTTPSL